MCGIFAVFNIKGNYSRVRSIVVKMLKRIIHRGPDSTGVSHYSEADNNVHHFVCHQRLSIVDPFQGDQPFFSNEGKICGVANGEIYNHIEVNNKPLFIINYFFIKFFLKENKYFYINFCKKKYQFKTNNLKYCLFHFTYLF